MKIKLPFPRTGIVLACICLFVFALVSCQSLRTSPGQLSTPAVVIVSPTPEVNQSSPQEAVLSFYQAFNTRNTQMMSALLDSEDESNQRFLRGFQEIPENALTLELSQPQIYVVEESKTWTRIRTNHHQKVFQDGHLIAEADSGGEFTLIQKGNKWYFLGVGNPIPPGWLLEQP